LTIHCPGKCTSLMWSPESGLVLLLLFVLLHCHAPAVLCLLYTAFVLPLLDYCDVVWHFTTTKLTAMIERVHSKFIKRLPPSNWVAAISHSHLSLQVSSEIFSIILYLQGILKMLQVMLVTMSIVFLFPECRTTMEREVFIIESLFYENFTICCSRGHLFKKLYFK